jgi:hypothetical protein
MQFSTYKTRPIRFLELYSFENWSIKIYSISSKNEFVSDEYLKKAKNQLSKWLILSETNALETYNIATLMLHECKEGCFAIINWWIDENMLQHYVYLTKNKSEEFTLFSSNGIVTCVWESAVIWFERNAWAKHVLLKNENPDFESYLNEQLNEDV